MKKISMFMFLAMGLLFLAGCGKTPDGTTTGTTDLDAFAKCLTQAGAKMYGTATCPYCLKQKEMFGESFQYVTYVDCVASPTLCGALEKIPTWEFADGSTTKGVQPLADLAAKTNCPLK